MFKRNKNQPVTVIDETTTELAEAMGVTPAQVQEAMRVVAESDQSLADMIAKVKAGLDSPIITEADPELEALLAEEETIEAGGERPEDDKPDKRRVQLHVPVPTSEDVFGAVEKGLIVGATNPVSSGVSAAIKVATNPWRKNRVSYREAYHNLRDLSPKFDKTQA